MMKGESSKSHLIMTKDETIRKRYLQYIRPIISVILFTIFLFLMQSERMRLFVNYFFLAFLSWIEHHPIEGTFAFVAVYSITVTFLIPGTPLIFGSGFVFSKAFGFYIGITTATILVVTSASIGSMCAFCLGRYLLGDWVRHKFSKYKFVGAIEAAMNENGFQILCLLHLSPIIPFGPISYLCGTTSMSLFTFLSSNISLFPLAILYSIIGASMENLVTTLSEAMDQHAGEKSYVWKFAFIICGICTSSISIWFLSHTVKKQLDKMMERQKKSLEV